jgi:pimeloyl-ACP methyl ester carboxylesterase
MRRTWRWILLVTLAVLLAGLIYFLIPLGPLDGTGASLVDSESVAVTDDPWLTFAPVDGPTTGFIFYPGARVNPESYAPAAREVADNGYLAVIVPMPLNLAILSPNRATAVIEAHPEIETWVIGGHSLGGAMAAQYANTRRTTIQGVVLWGTVLGVNTSLRNSGQAVLAVYGTQDCISTPEEVLAAAIRLPEDATLVPIEGGNHAQFGWYDGQPGGCIPSVSLEEQQTQAVEAVIEFLKDLDR